MPKKDYHAHAHAMTQQFHADHAIVDYIQRWGHVTSTRLLDSACQIFYEPGIEGIIGYRFEAGCAIVFGNPVCTTAYRQPLMQAFHSYCNPYAKNIVHIAVSPDFVEWGLLHGYKKAVAIGNEVVLDPQHDPKLLQGATGINLRKKWNKAARQSLITKEYIGHDPRIEQGIEYIGAQWLRNRHGIQIYLLQLDLFAHRANKRWFFAEQGDHIIGVIMFNRLDTHNGWYMNMLITLPDAPKITSEVLLLSALDTLRSEGCTFVSVGTIAMPTVGTMKGISPFAQRLAHYGYKIATKLFKLTNRYLFWKKFRPLLTPSYLLSAKGFGPRTILGIMRAMNVNI